ncbi:hypothetical protein OEA41_003560 [Lepraria neglecta]|uniref:Uncharacterized protein n=1 Tax=Lepraria neglecta TaxID=209136 RepID=A0AAE0DJ51_9LECA|nr:hypothetical protein OEA41_003560 [Lepraria neglecta]
MLEVSRVSSGRVTSYDSSSLRWPRIGLEDDDVEAFEQHQVRWDTLPSTISGRRLVNGSFYGVRSALDDDGDYPDPYESTNLLIAWHGDSFHAIVPEATQRGDFVASFHGIRLPFVVRLRRNPISNADFYVLADMDWMNFEEQKDCLTDVMIYSDNTDTSGSVSTDFTGASSSLAFREAGSEGTESKLEHVEPYDHTETSFENDEAWAEISISRPRQPAESPWVPGPIPEGDLLRNATRPHGDQSDSNRRSNERREGDTEDFFEYEVSGIDETCEQGSTTQLSRQNSENSESESMNAIENDEMDNGDETASDHEGYKEELSDRKGEQTLGESNVEPTRTSEKTESVFEESPTLPPFLHAQLSQTRTLISRPFERTLAAGKKRRCGHNLYDDFTELRPGALAELEQNLNAHAGFYRCNPILKIPVRTLATLVARNLEVMARA